MICLVGKCGTNTEQTPAKECGNCGCKHEPERNAGHVGKPAMNVENATISQLCAEVGNDKVRRPTKPA